MSRAAFVPADDAAFEAELRVGQLGPVRLARLSLERCSIERAQSDVVAGANRMYEFVLQAEGSSTFHHYGREAQLGEGDLVLCDTGLPHHWGTTGSSTTIIVSVRPEMLRRYLPTPEQYCGQRLPRAGGVADTVGAIVRSLIGQVEHRCWTGNENQIARSLLELIALSYSMAFAGELKGTAILWQRRNAVIKYIEDHLRDPNLGPRTIAAGLRLTPRYLRTIFATSDERISPFILRRRLGECARQMRDPRWSEQTLTEIAFSWGFNSAAHFTRSFHKQYGVAPGAYRSR